MLQKIFVLKDHFIRVMQKCIVSSCLPENFKLLTLPVLEICSVYCGFSPQIPKDSVFD